MKWRNLLTYMYPKYKKHLKPPQLIEIVLKNNKLIFLFTKKGEQSPEAWGYYVSLDRQSTCVLRVGAKVTVYFS